MLGRLLASLCILFGLAACADLPKTAVRPALHDLGVQQPVPSMQNLRVAIKRLEVQAPSWFNSPAMQYRVSPNSSERRVFSQNRWAAPPSEMLALALEQALLPGGASALEGCRIQVYLDEFTQVFDGTQSAAYIQVRVSLLDTALLPLASKTFKENMPVEPTPDAGVHGFKLGVQELSGALSEWLLSQDLTRCQPKHGAAR